MDFALIYERTENDHDIYARYRLSDAKNQLHKIDEIRIKSAEKAIAGDWAEQGVEGHGTG